MDLAPVDLCGAQVVVRVGDHFLLQRKTAGYPLPHYVGRFCLIGGSWTHADDRSPRETAWRELSEELRPTSLFSGVTAADLVHCGSYGLTLPAQATGSRLFRTWNFLFGFHLDADTPLGTLSLTEGELVVVPRESVSARRFAWGHDLLLAASGIVMPSPEQQRGGHPDDIQIRRLVPGEPPPYCDLDLGRVRVNPLRSGDVPDLEPFTSTA